MFAWLWYQNLFHVSYLLHDLRNILHKKFRSKVSPTTKNLKMKGTEYCWLESFGDKYDQCMQCIYLS